MVYGFLATLRCLPKKIPEVRIVPKFAATLASLLLIASSIGVNIARYPQVGRTIDAGQRTGATEPANIAAAARQTSPIETVNPETLPPRESESEPARPPQAAAVAPTTNPRPEGPSGPPPISGTAGPQPQPAVPILEVRPMVPVASLQTAGGADPPVGADEVRRLPPVEPAGSAVAELPAAELDEAQSYPATPTP